ncbi:MAG: DUF5818 domain-containing protein [Sphingobium sp.]
MNIGSYFRLEGVLLAGAMGLFVQARNGALWEIGKLKDVGHLLHGNVIVEGIRTGAEAIAVNWIEAAEPFKRAMSAVCI